MLSVPISGAFVQMSAGLIVQMPSAQLQPFLVLVGSLEFVQFLAAQIKSSFNWKELQYLGTETLALSKIGVRKVTLPSWKFGVKIRCFLHQISF